MKKERTLNLINTIILLTLSCLLHTEINAQQISVIKVYPTTLRIEKRKIKNINGSSLSEQRKLYL